MAELTTTLTADGAVDTISGNGYLLDLDWNLSTRPGSPLISRLEKRGPGYGEVWVPRYTSDLKLDGVTVTRSNGDIIVENYDMSAEGLPRKLERIINEETLLSRTLAPSVAGGSLRTDRVDASPVLYDVAGNLQRIDEGPAAGRKETYGFDGRRRMHSLQFQRRNGSLQTLTYVYDAEDRRIKTSDTPTLEPRVYAWQGSRLIAIGNQTGAGIRWTHAIGQGPGGPAFIEDLVGDEDYFIFADHLGTPFAYQNAHTGTVYYAPTNPWGELWDHDAAAPAPFEESNRPIPMVQDKDAQGNPVGVPHPLYAMPPFTGFTGPPLGLAGHLRDGRTGLIYMHHRSLHPRLGHFLNPDFRLPDIFDPTTYKEPYAYAAGNPIMFWDPDGLYARSIHGYFTYFTALAAGLSEARAREIAYFAWGPDATKSLNAIGIMFKDITKTSRVQQLHVIYPAPQNIGEKRAHAAEALRTLKLRELDRALAGRSYCELSDDQKFGLISHYFQDSYAHTNSEMKDDPNPSRRIEVARWRGSSETLARMTPEEIDEMMKQTEEIEEDYLTFSVPFGHFRPLMNGLGTEYGHFGKEEDDPYLKPNIFKAMASQYYDLMVEYAMKTGASPTLSKAEFMVYVDRLSQIPGSSPEHRDEGREEEIFNILYEVYGFAPVRFLPGDGEYEDFFELLNHAPSK